MCKSNNIEKVAQMKIAQHSRNKHDSEVFKRLYALDYHKFVPHDQFDIRDHHTDFETEATIKRTEVARVRILRNSPDHHDQTLADQLENCHRRCPCGLAACPACMARARVFVCSEMLRLLHYYEDEKLRALHLVSQLDRYAPDEITPTDLHKPINRLRKQLARSGDCAGLLMIGGVDLDYDVLHDQMQVGLHLIAPIEDPKQFKQMLKKGVHSNRSSTTVHKPVFLQRVDDRGRQFAYCFKAFAERKERYRRATGARNSRKYPMKADQYRTWLRLMSEVGPMHLLVLINARRAIGPEIVLTSRYWFKSSSDEKCTK
jgi:hypothetical protein